MNRYNQIEEQANLGFAPDSSFPLTYAEKGLLQVKLHGPGWMIFLTSWSGPQCCSRQGDLCWSWFGRVASCFGSKWGSV